jgi:hypothetical protein
VRALDVCHDLDASREGTGGGNTCMVDVVPERSLRLLPLKEEVAECIGSVLVTVEVDAI